MPLAQRQVKAARGVAAAALSAAISTATGTFLERVLQQANAGSNNFWATNWGLSLWGSLVGGLVLWWEKEEEQGLDHLFRGFDQLVWTLVFAQSAGGLVISGEDHPPPLQRIVFFFCCSFHP